MRMGGGVDVVCSCHILVYKIKARSLLFWRECCYAGVFSFTEIGISITVAVAIVNHTIEGSRGSTVATASMPKSIAVTAITTILTVSCQSLTAILLLLQPAFFGTGDSKEELHDVCSGARAHDFQQSIGIIITLQPPPI